jgi:hypothetical protein
MMRIAPLLLVAGLAIGASGIAAAQDARLVPRLDSATLAAVTAIVDSARAAGLPTEPLVDRALEGASKRAAGHLIIAAVRARAHELGQARDALGRRATPAELEAGAAALHAGVAPAHLARFRAARGTQSVVVPLAVLADLVARGVPPDTAATLLAAIVGDVADAELLAIERDVERDIALGAPPLAAAAVRVSVGIREGRALDQGAAPRPRRP